MDNVTDKIYFMKDFFSRIINGHFDILGNTYMVDLKTILLDISGQLKRFLTNYQSDNSDILMSISSILQSLNNELKNYISNETYYIRYKEIRTGLDELIHYLGSISYAQVRTKTKWSIAQKNCCFIEKSDIISTMLIESLTNKNYFFDIFNDIIMRCLDSDSSLINEKERIKMRVVEAVFAAYSANLSKEFLLEHLKAIDKITKSQDLSNLDKWKILIKPLPKQDIVYYFLVTNLKLMIPLNYNNILFYNPFRLDLLKMYCDTEFSVYDYHLLTREEQEFIHAKFPEYDPYDESKCVIPLGKAVYSESEHDKILQSDCHARVIVKAETGASGLDIARNKINNTLRALNIFGLLYHYEEKELKHYIYKETEIEYNASMPMWTSDETFISPYGIRETSRNL